MQPKVTQKRCKSQTGNLVQPMQPSTARDFSAKTIGDSLADTTLTKKAFNYFREMRANFTSDQRIETPQTESQTYQKAKAQTFKQAQNISIMMTGTKKFNSSKFTDGTNTSQATKFGLKFKNPNELYSNAETPQPPKRLQSEKRDSKMTKDANSLANKLTNKIESEFKHVANKRSNFSIKKLLMTESFQSKIMTDIRLEEIIKTNKIGQPSRPIIKEQPLESQATSALLQKLKDIRILREADQTQYSSCNNYSALDLYDQNSEPYGSEGKFSSLNRGDNDITTDVEDTSWPEFFKLNLSKVEKEKQQTRKVKHAVRRGFNKLNQKSPKPNKTAFDLPTELFEFKVETERNALMGNDEAKFIDQLKYQRLYNSLYFLPLILAPGLAPEEDKDYAVGCNLMLEGKYVRAIQHFKMTENEFSSEELSNSQSQVFSSDSQNQSGSLETSISLKRVIEQDVVSFDSSMDQLRLNKTAFDLQLIKERFNPDGTQVRRQSTLKTGNDMTFQQIRRHMYYFNIAVCFAKCGYTQKAQQTMMTVAYQDFQAVADFNKAIFELLDKRQDHEKALSFITSAIRRLEVDPPREWLIIDEIKRRISFALLFLRERFVKIVDKAELAVQIHQFKLDQLKHEVFDKSYRDFLENYKTVDRLLIRVALIKPNGVLDMIPQARKEFALITKYLEGVRIQNSKQALFEERSRPEKPKKSSSKFNLEMKLDGLNVVLPFQNVPLLGDAGNGEGEESPMKNDVLQRLSARSRKKDKINAIKRAKSQMAYSRRRFQLEKAQQSAIKMNPFNEQYLGIKQSAKAMKLLELGDDQNQDYWIGMSGCLQKAYDSSIVGQHFDSLNIRTRSEAAKNARIDRELARIKKMSVRDIQKVVGLVHPVVNAQDVEDSSSKDYSTQKILQERVELDFKKSKFEPPYVMMLQKRTDDGNILDIENLQIVKNEKARRNFQSAQVSVETETTQKKEDSVTQSALPLRRYEKKGYTYIKEYTSDSSDDGLSQLQSQAASLESAQKTFTSQKISSVSYEQSSSDQLPKHKTVTKQASQRNPSKQTSKVTTPKPEKVDTEDTEDQKGIKDGIYEIKLGHEDVANIIERQYINTQIQLYKLNLMLDDPAKFRKLRLTLAYQDVADRISSIRKQTKFAQEIIRFQKIMKLPQLQDESQKQIVKSLQTAFDVYTEVPFYTERLRNSEIKKMMEYKENINNCRICDFREIHRSLNKLTWFSAVSYQTQQLILAKSYITVHKEGDILLKQGSESQTVFVVIRGVVKVTTTRYDWGTDVTTVLKSVYDGAVFGETASFEMDDQYRKLAKKYLSTQKYTFTVQEPSIILSINQKDLNTLRQNNLAEEFADRLQFLQQVDLFKGIQLENLLPIAHNIVSKKFKLGQLLLKAGEIPEGLIIIKSGYCKVGLDQLQVKKIMNEEFTWNRNKPINFKFNGDFMTPMRVMNYKRPDELDEAQKLKEYQKTFYQLDYNQHIISNSSQLRKKMRIFAPQTRKIDKDYNIPPPGQTVVQQFVEFFTLQQRQHYGGRILLDDLSLRQTNDDAQRDDIHNVIGRKPPYRPELVPQIEFKPAEPEKGQKHPVMNGYGVKFPPSLLTVVADSAEVEVLIIDRVQLSLVSDSIQRYLVANLKESISLERPYSQTELDKVKMQKEKDIQMQQAVVKKIYISNFFERTGCSFQR